MKKGVAIYRDTNGIVHINGDTRDDAYWGQGYAHAKDRGLQMLLMRILAQGRGSEILDSSDEMLAIDTFFRKMNWTGNIEDCLSTLSETENRFLNAYCDGVNAVLKKKIPWELRLLGYKFEPWRPEDCIIISRMMGYLTLAQSQGEMERLLVELVQADISSEKLAELFPGVLGGLDTDLLKKVRIGERIVEPSSLWNQPLPRMMASNNWVISGKITASGKPIICNDPHLEINRLPNVWAEHVVMVNDDYIIGGTMPGAPGVFTGRTSKVAWGVTYAFIDTIDSWVENCSNGKYLYDGKWLDFRERKEVIRRKKKPETTVVFYENQHGVLDGNPYDDGYYLSTRWAAADCGAATFSAIFKIWDIETVDEGMAALRQIETGWSIVLADIDGEIGFQMTGRVPKRRDGLSGFVPVPGWEPENDWLGFNDPLTLPQIKNPEAGFFSTANQNLNQYGIDKPITICMGSYRSDRIDALLSSRNNLTKEDMYKMHGDLYSTQAELFMAVLRPLLPDTPQGEILKDWDLTYPADSKGAYLFESVYRQLYQDVFGDNGFGNTVIDYLADETGIFIDFYDNFDKILLSEKSEWFNGKNREEIFRKAAEKALDVEPKPWGTGREFMLTHLLFGNRLPRFLGFDRGPVQAVGNRATIHQGQIYKSAGRDTTFMPSLRIVTDLAEDTVYSNMAGGPSDRRFSKWYHSDFSNWDKGRYKKLSPIVKNKRPL